MLRKLMMLLASALLVCGGISTSAWSASQANIQLQTFAVQTPANATKNEPPLAPGPAAGIQEAQGVIGTGLILIGLLAVAAIVGLVLLIDDDSDDATSTGTN